jgi:alanine racemase
VISPSRPTRAFLSKSALLHNLKLLRGQAKVPVMAVVKAEAYGHGAALVAPLLQKAGVTLFAVATLEEALALRQAGIRGEILVFGAVEPSGLARAASARIGVTAWSRAMLKAASRHALAVHLKVDTGMSRLGFLPAEIPGVLADFESGRFGRLELASAYTHLACADEPKDKASARQLAAFRALPWPVELPLHAANSAGALRYAPARFDLVRSGIFLYGALDPIHPLAGRSRPVLSLTTRVLRVAALGKGQGVSYGHTFKATKAMKIATLAAGYADGVPRLLSNKGSVLIGGKRCRLLGRVCMDLCMADVSAVKNAKPGDEAVLLGGQGRERVTANEWAALCGTNSYEILCGISFRVPRELAA